MLTESLAFTILTCSRRVHKFNAKTVDINVGYAMLVMSNVGTWDAMTK